jgi:hypothetical protein
MQRGAYPLQAVKGGQSFRRPLDFPRLRADGSLLSDDIGVRNGATGPKPETIVRKNFSRHLVDHYGYSLAQMDHMRRAHSFRSGNSP